MTTKKTTATPPAPKLRKVPKVNIHTMKDSSGLTWKQYAEALEMSQREMMRYAAKTNPKTLPAWLRLAVMAFDEYCVGGG